MFLTVLLGTILTICIIAYLSSRSKAKTLRAAPKGSVRVEAIKAARVNNTVAEYARLGWRVSDQSMAKSFGSQARVTLTFVKGQR